MPNSTIFDRFREAADKYSKNVALGYKVEGSFKTISYKKLLSQINRCATGLRKMGVKEGAKVAIFSKNRTELVILDLALNKIGAVSVFIHTTFSPKIIKYILENSEAEYLAVGALFSKYQEIEKQVSLRAVIAFNEINWKEGLVYFNDLLKQEEDDQPAADFNICTFVYTSGTTGNPKGVMLTNSNFLSNIDSAVKYVPYTSKDVFLSFLPISHVLERTGGYYAPLINGGAVYFAESVKTISDDIRKVRPTVLVSVPRIFEKTYDKIMDKVRSSSSLQQQLFYSSLNISRRHIKYEQEKKTFTPLLGLLYYLANKLVLKKIRSKLGGRLKFSISGGAALNPSIAKFFEAIGVKILEGYGLTETSPIIAVNPLDGYKFNTVGRIIEGVEVKIADDKEILVKGPNVMEGYYNNQAQTDETFDRDGWFLTGDLGYLDSDNYLTVIGRKKEMIVTSTGKNVNPVDLENALQESKYIHQVMVYGDNKKFISALIVPDFEELNNYATENNLEQVAFKLIKEEKILNLYREELDRQLKEFPENEKIGDFRLLEREFSEERDELTPTLKLRRKKILDNFLPN